MDETFKTVAISAIVVLAIMWGGSLVGGNQSGLSESQVRSIIAEYLELGGSTSDNWSVGGNLSVTGTSDLTGNVGVASSSPTEDLSVGSGGATSTTMGGNFCAFFQDEAGRGMWITLATSGNTVFATSTTACNN